MKKKLFLAAVLLGMATSMSAQLLNVGSVEKVAVPADLVLDRAVISPDGKTLVVASGQALSQVDLATGSVAKVTDNGAISDLKFTGDSRAIVFNRPTYKKNLRQTAVLSYDLASGKESTLVKPSRNLKGFATNGSNVMTVDNKKLRVANLAGEQTVSAPVASVYYGQLMVTVDGKTNAIDPLGKGSYLWPSVSPDGTKVVYYFCGKGCYVSNLDGTDAKFVGSIRAPRWIDNSTVVGMNDADNGQYVTSSSIVAADLNGTTQTLTNADVIAMYPSADGAVSKIAFTTPAGEAYIINVNR